VSFAFSKPYTSFPGTAAAGDMIDGAASTYNVVEIAATA